MSTIHVQPTRVDAARVDYLRRHLAGRNGRPATTSDVVRYALRVATRRLKREENKRGQIEDRAGG